MLDSYRFSQRNTYGKYSLGCSILFESMSGEVNVLKWVVSGNDAVVMRCCVVVDGGHVDSVRVTPGAVWLWVAVDVVLVPVLVLRMSLVVPNVLVSRPVELNSSAGRVISDGVDDVFSIGSKWRETNELYILIESKRKFMDAFIYLFLWLLLV